MVAEIVKRHKRYYVCDECGLGYVKLELAEKCEAWHAEHPGCNSKIIDLAVNIRRPCMFCGARIKRKVPAVTTANKQRRSGSKT